MNKYICIKSYFGYKEVNNSFVYRKSNKSNFCIEEGTIVLINFSEEGYVDIFDENLGMICYINDDYKNWFQLFSEWRDLRINQILEDD